METVFKKGFIRFGSAEARFSLRKPTQNELCEFRSAERNAVSLRAMTAEQSRAWLFDLLLIGVENLLTAGGDQVTVQNKGEIPSIWKSAVIEITFDDHKNRAAIYRQVQAIPAQQKGQAVQLMKSL